jgi:hypothetical protein
VGGLNIKLPVRGFTYFQEINNEAVVFVYLFFKPVLPMVRRSSVCTNGWSSKQLTVRVGKLLILFALVE